RSAIANRDWAGAKNAVLAQRSNPLYRYINDERQLNSLGYEFLGKRSFVEAIEVFKLNVETHPDSWNVYNSLAEAYAVRRDVTKDDLRQAEQNYQRSLQLNPQNSRARAALEHLKQH